MAALALIDILEHRGDSGRLAAAGDAGEDDDALVVAGDLTQDRQRHDVALDGHPEGRDARGQAVHPLAFRSCREPERTRAVAASFEEPISLKRDQVMVHCGGRGKADGVGDLADGGRVSALRHGPRDALEDLLSPVDVVPCQAGDSIRGAAVSEDPSRTGVLSSSRCGASEPGQALC